MAEESCAHLVSDRAFIHGMLLVHQFPAVLAALQEEDLRGPDAPNENVGRSLRLDELLQDTVRAFLSVVQEVSQPCPVQIF